VAAVLAVVAIWASLPYLTAARFLVALTGQPAWAARHLPRSGAVPHRDVEVPTRHGPVAARIYQPDGRASRTLAVFPGVHAGGVDEPRLAELSSRLAATGAVVVSAPLPELRRYLVTPRSTDAIEDVTAWVASREDLAPDGVVGIVGVSFAGGLAIVAGGRPSIRDRVSAVVSIGGYGDLPRVMRFLCTGRTAAGGAMPPNDYGVAVLLLGAVESLVPANQAVALRRVIRTMLDAGSAQRSDPSRAAVLAAEAARDAATLPAPASELAALALARDVTALGPRLLPFVETLGSAPALSPERSPAPAAPVFLLHGADDDLIPPSETTRLADDLRARGVPRVRALITPFLSHADVEPRTSIADGWALLRFWSALLRASD